jgi:hypothetical protein
MVGTWLVGDIEEFDDTSRKKEFGKVEDSGCDIEQDWNKDYLPELGKSEVFEKNPSK